MCQSQGGAGLAEERSTIHAFDYIRELRTILRNLVVYGCETSRTKTRDLSKHQGPHVLCAGKLRANDTKWRRVYDNPATLP